MGQARRGYTGVKHRPNLGLHRLGKPVTHSYGLVSMYIKVSGSTSLYFAYGQSDTLIAFPRRRC